MTGADDAPREWHPRMLPPMWLVLGLLAQWALHVLAPGPTLVEGSGRLVGIAPIALGLLLDAWGVVTFARARTGIIPGSPAAVLVLGGPYRFTRNPMYVGMTLVLVGSALLWGAASGFLVPIVFCVIIDRRFVRREEALLRRTFGEAAWTEYASGTRRWL